MSTTSMGNMPGDPLDGLPATFSYRAARVAGISNVRLYQLRDEGIIMQIGRGLYRRADATSHIDLDLLEIAHRTSVATLCLATALARYDLTDDNPAIIHIALPRGQRHPEVTPPVAWHSFDRPTFYIGRDTVNIGNEVVIGIYSPARCIVDAYRMPHISGYETANIALRRWLRLPGSHPAVLEEIARHFPRAQRRLRAALEVLTSG